MKTSEMMPFILERDGTGLRQVFSETSFPRCALEANARFDFARIYSLERGMTAACLSALYLQTTIEVTQRVMAA